MKSKQRIIWIDIAKAIAIIMMIIGHEVAFGGKVRNLIFSFHMPLFFILTGYTMKPVDNVYQLAKQIKKDIARIIVPCVVVQVLNWIIFFFLYGGEPVEIIKNLSQQLIWASAVNVGEHPALGALWFLVVLFWSKIGLSIIDLIFPKKNKLIICLFLSLGSVLISSYSWLPQSLDVTLMAILFLYMGRIIKEYYAFLLKYANAIVSIAFLVWMLCWQNGLYIEMGARSYPVYPLCIIEAIGGCMCVIYLSMSLEITHVSKILAPIGKISLIILCVHHLDGYFSGIWNTYGVLEKCIIQVGFDVMVAFFISILKAGLKKICSKEKSLDNLA